MNLQENISRVKKLMGLNENFTEKKLYHLSRYPNRESIRKKGLIPTIGQKTTNWNVNDPAPDQTEKYIYLMKTPTEIAKALFGFDMKYIVTEGQYNLILESSLTNWVRRRANEKILKKHISDGEINFPTLCDDFDDEYHYAEKVITWAIVDFLDGYEWGDYIDEPDYVEVRDYLNELCKNLFGEYLMDVYRQTCSEE